jgi:chromosomal replication initiator protein
MHEIDKNIFWKDTLESLKVSVSPAIFSTWFSQTHLVDIEEKDDRVALVVGCNSSFVKTTLESRYFGLIQDTIIATVGKPCDLSFAVKQIENSPGSEIIAPLFTQQKEADDQFSAKLRSSKLRPNYNFENFAVSTTNQMAWAAAEAVSKNPGSAYNPLFLWGGVGVGKTHLMSAVGFSILKKNPGSKVLLFSGEEFTNDIVEGIRNKSTQHVREKYRRLDGLLVDDIQFIAGKDAVQEEFFHTFNAVTSAGGQVILTSDRPPSEISKLEERLRSRFEAGLIVDIGTPDFELRCAILQIKAAEKGMEIPMELVQLIAANIDSARKIEGFLIRLGSDARQKNTEITEELITSLLGKSTSSDATPIKASPSDVIDAVAKYYSLGKRALLGESRARPVARPRQVLMYILRVQLGLPLEEVGRLIGGRDHTTVMHAVEKIQQLATSDVQIREDIVGIKKAI